LQRSGEPTKLNQFTTKNVALRDEHGTEYNAIINGRIAYRRAPRGQNVQDFSDILYGPMVKQITSANYKQIKKGGKIYYDRGSVVMRGPFIFKGLRRGPELLLEIKDAVYDKKYLFTISVKKLKDEKLYMVSKSTTKRHTKKHTKKRRKKGGAMTTRGTIPRTRRGTARFNPFAYIKRKRVEKNMFKVPSDPTVGFGTTTREEMARGYDAKVGLNSNLCRYLPGHKDIEQGIITRIINCQTPEQCRKEYYKLGYHEIDYYKNKLISNRFRPSRLIEFSYERHIGDGKYEDKKVWIPTGDGDPDNLIPGCSTLQTLKNRGADPSCEIPRCPEVRRYETQEFLEPRARELAQLNIDGTLAHPPGEDETKGAVYQTPQLRKTKSI